ncbi:MAG: SURF1 family protein [Methylococcales bacterium]
MNRLISIAAFLVLVCVLTGLGFWQLQRADEKQLLMDQQADQLSRAPAQLQVDSDHLAMRRFQPVYISGQFDCQHQLLLDNKMLKGKPGFHVITAFHPSTAIKSILVNRGWIPMHANREPDQQYQDCPDQLYQLQGVINNFPGLGYHFSGSTQSTTENWPLILLELDAEVLSAALNYPVVDYLLLMDPKLEAGFVRDWSFTPNILPEKHVAYAVQWFALAITLICISLWRLWRNNNDKQQ